MLDILSIKDKFGNSLVRHSYSEDENGRGTVMKKKSAYLNLPLSNCKLEVSVATTKGSNYYKEAGSENYADKSKRVLVSYKKGEIKKFATSEFEVWIPGHYKDIDEKMDKKYNDLEVELTPVVYSTFAYITAQKYLTTIVKKKDEVSKRLTENSKQILKTFEMAVESALSGDKVDCQGLIDSIFGGGQINLDLLLAKEMEREKALQEKEYIKNSKKIAKNTREEDENEGELE